MIQNQHQLQQARTALARLEDSLLALRERVYNSNPGLFFAMAGDYRDSITEVRTDIDAYLGAAEMLEYQVPLWMTLHSNEMDGRDISSRVLTEWLGRFRKALYGVASFLETGQLPTGGRPDAMRLELTDPKVLAVSPGSIRIGLRLPEPDPAWQAKRAKVPDPREALEKLLELAVWATAGTTEMPPELYRSVDELGVVAKYAATLAPSPRTAVRSVVFAGALVPAKEHLRLDVKARVRLKGLVKLLTHANEETVRGVLKEIDLDARRITLRERGPKLPDLKCIVPADQMEIAESLLGHSVSVHGVVYSAKPDTLLVISIVEDQRGSRPSTS